MGNYNSYPGSNETATPTLESAKKPSKESKTTTSSETPRNNTKQKVAPDLGKTIERSLFNNRSELTDAAPKVAETKPQTDSKKPEQTRPELLNDEEVLYVRQTIASDHLEAIHTQADQATSEVLQPAVDFLERVKDGQEPEAAAAEVDDGLLADSETEDDDREFKANEDGDESDEFAPENQPENIPAPNTPPPAGGGGANGRPPRPPIPPTGPSPSGAPTPPNPGNQPSGVANILPAAANTYYANRRQRDSANTLVGGLAGYLLGRRQGRRKAEKRLLPVQQQLERQVSHLEQSITATEQQLIATKASLLERRQTRPFVIERLPTPFPEKRENSSSQRVNERMQPGLQETRLGMEKPQRAEHLGHVAIGTEAAKIIEQTRFERPNNIRQAFRPEVVKTMHRNELLELSEKITVEGASLRRIYESRLITEKQLRHVVGEYLAGKDIRRELRRQMVEREIDFERDPQLRDRVRSHLSSNGGNNGLNELLQTVGAMPEDNTKLTKQEQRQADKQAAAKQKQQRNRKLADGAMATAIVVLTLIVVALLLR